MTSHPSIRNLEPTHLWSAFDDLNAIPRPSKGEAGVSQFIVDQGKRLGLTTLCDRWGNVLIRKPATIGYESHPTVVLQSHLDMVWQKNADCAFDFTSEGIKMCVEGDWVRAEGTTLGADNGIGVAAILAILASKTSSIDLKHPPLECLFTTDEETGMTGAKQLEPTWLTGSVLLNLDTEQDHELTIGCAGGVDVTAKGEYQPEQLTANHACFAWKVRGLKGGHSGMEIHLGRANANKIINRLLWLGQKQFDLRLHALDGGSLRNAIPREATATVCLPHDQASPCEAWLPQVSQIIQHEYMLTDPLLRITCEPLATPVRSVLPLLSQQRLIAALDGALSGIHRMSPSIPGLVQTSNNLARVAVGEGRLEVHCLTRSSVDSERDELARCLRSVFEGIPAEVDVRGDYPGWQPNPKSQVVQQMTQLYQELFNGAPHVAACHAGLECGILGAKKPGMDMVSFGPNILGAHSPDERVQISSVQKFWRFLLETLARL